MAATWVKMNSETLVIRGIMMYGFKKKIVLLIILMMIFFNIERIDVGQENLINMNSFVYVLGSIGVLVPFFVHIKGRFSLEILVMAIIGIYFFCSTILSKSHPLWGGIYTYLSITELVFFVAIVNLAQSVAKETRILSQQVEFFFLSEQPTACPTLDQSMNKLEVEITRCRRYKRNLGVILVEPQYDLHLTVESMQDMHPIISKSLILRAVGNFLQLHIRRPDWVLNNVAKNQFIIVCPESDCVDLENAITRLHDSIYCHLKILANIGYAAFPDDAITLEGLFLKAESRLSLSSGENVFKSE
jgi:hypothetical protein